MAIRNDMSSSADYLDRGNEDQNEDSVNSQDQNRRLLRALQDFIIPLIQVATQETQNDANQIPLGPEADKLLIALRGFISSTILRSQPRAKNEILVEAGLVVEDPNEREGSLDSVDGGEEPFSSELNGRAIPDNDSEKQAPLDNAEPIFHDKLLSALRKHVFNTMPIRLLCFEPHGSGFQITLIERGLIYQRLESMVRVNIHQADHYLQPDRSSPLLSPYPVLETEQKAIDRLISKYAKYAILSHTWLRTSGEVTYSDWNKGLFDAEDPGYQKLVNFCKVAWKDHKLTLGWMDTVCINKESSSELDESIRSMYAWYSRADVCISYLAETTALPTMHADPWFTRGWTLQELLAPRFIKFYNSDWKRLVDNSDNDKKNAKITGQIEQATTITKNELERIHHTHISRRMQLAAIRQVTREEDTAYSLMGIFNVSIATAYGEGATRAFFRLLQEILASRQWDVLDILNWAGSPPYPRPYASHILPSSPQYYIKSSRLPLSLGRPMEPLVLTHLGLRVPVLLMPAITIPSVASQYVPIGDFYATVNIHPLVRSTQVPNATYNLLDKRIYSQDGRQDINISTYQCTLAVFNIFGDAASIRVRKRCIAKVLRCIEDVGKVTSTGDVYNMHTDVPIVFDLNNATTESSLIERYTIERDDLKKHGMQLVSLYL